MKINISKTLLIVLFLSVGFQSYAIKIIINRIGGDGSGNFSSVSRIVTTINTNPNIEGVSPNWVTTVNIHCADPGSSPCLNQGIAPRDEDNSDILNYYGLEDINAFQAKLSEINNLVSSGILIGSQNGTLVTGSGNSYYFTISWSLDEFENGEMILNFDPI